MKKYLLILSACSIFACGGDKKSETSGAEQTVGVSPEENPLTTEPAQTDPQAEGRELIAGSDCVACHKEQGKLIGPGYDEVAQKYQPNDTTITYLANKVIKGGAGNWGNVPMTPHPQFTEEEASKMVRYILSLK